MGRKKSAKKRSHVNRKQQVSLTPDKGTTVQRTYKDSLFRFIFKDKQKLLKLYNALNGTDHRDIDSLFVTTIENVLYIGYKNDVSFLLDNTLNLYEHQGSWNPNMPLRGVLYFARLLQDYTEASQFNLYGSKRIPLPYPKYIIFYNGTAVRPEREVLRLSDSYPASAADSEGEPALECTALVININYGQNREIMEQCRPLWDYAVFIHYIRNSLLDGYSVQDAVDLAVERCLKEDILTDVLRAHRKEVTAMFLEEYDQEQHYKTLRDEGYEDGFEDGFDNGLEKFRALSDKLVENNRKDDIIRAATDRDFQKKLFKEYGL
ncbi:MAG: hypothetical protein Q4C77_07640 [Eubacteriales bacterium]|nr:hypothetical protein [Eubacteriales bacterium]